MPRTRRRDHSWNASLLKRCSTGFASVVPQIASAGRHAVDPDRHLQRARDCGGLNRQWRHRHEGEIDELDGMAEALGHGLGGDHQATIQVAAQEEHVEHRRRTRPPAHGGHHERADQHRRAFAANVRRMRPRQQPRRKRHEPQAEIDPGLRRRDTGPAPAARRRCRCPASSRAGSRHMTCSRHTTARQPLAVIWVIACKVMAAGTGRNSSSTPIRTSPPIMPKMPLRNDVASAATATAVSMLQSNISLGPPIEREATLSLDPNFRHYRARSKSGFLRPRPTMDWGQMHVAAELARVARRRGGACVSAVSRPRPRSWASPRPPSPAW